MRDVYAYELIANPRPNNPYHIPTRSLCRARWLPIAAADERAWSTIRPFIQDSLHFVQTAYSDWDYIKVKRLYRTRECDSYERLGLGESD